MNAASKYEVAEHIATTHYRLENAISRIYRLLAANEASEDEPIKLLEINAHTFPAGIQPVYFGPHRASGILCPSVIVEIVPDEFGDTLIEQLRREYGWEVGPAYERAEQAILA